MIKKIGHRGAAGTAPENTLASFRQALAAGVDGVELDIHPTRDGHLVVIHDFTLDRTTSGQGEIAKLSLDEVRRHDAGRWKGVAFAGERVPTLAETAELIAPHAQLFIELKAGSVVYPGVEEMLTRFILDRGLEGKVQISSFDHQALARLSKLLPGVQLAVLYSHLPMNAVAMARECGAGALHPKFDYVTAEMVAEAHRHGLVVNPWTVNHPGDILTARAMGVDGIISDYPERL